MVWPPSHAIVVGFLCALFPLSDDASYRSLITHHITSHPRSIRDKWKDRASRVVLRNPTLILHTHILSSSNRLTATSYP